MALSYFPLPRPTIPRAIVIGDSGLKISRNMTNISEATDKEKARAEEDDRKDVVGYKEVAEVNYSVMDRMGPTVTEEEE